MRGVQSVFKSCVVWDFVCCSLAFGLSARAAETNSMLVWHKAADRVDADIHGVAALAAAGRHRPSDRLAHFCRAGRGAQRLHQIQESAADDALRMLLGEIEFCPGAADQRAALLYVFTTRMENATQRVRAPRDAAQTRAQ